MIRPSSQYLDLMNTTVALVLIIPVMLFGLILSSQLPSRSKGGPSGEIYDQPPIISLPESQGYSFESGRAALTPEFQKALHDKIVPRIKGLLARYKCDIVEVVGHTDSQKVAANSNLDRNLLSAAQEQALTDPLSPGSNADLGLMRAWALIDFLRQLPELHGVAFYGYSAAQAIRPDGTLASASDTVVDPNRRRIEIRVRRRDKATK